MMGYECLILEFECKLYDEKACETPQKYADMSSINDI